MTTFTMIVIMSILMILGGIALLATPLITFMSAGYFIIIFFLLSGIFGIARAVIDKRYDKEFFFAILSLILGIIGFVVPGAAAMNNFILLYMAACWFIVHGILTFLAAIDSKKNGAGTIVMVLGIALGVLEIIIGIYSIAHPSVLAVSLGLLIGFYFIESGVNAIIIGSAKCKGGNGLTVLFTVMGVLTIITGFCMLATPLLTFMSIGYAIVALLFLNGVLGVVEAVIEKRYGKKFWFALISLILGLVGFAVPAVANMNNTVLLYIAAAWFFFHGVLCIIDAIAEKKAGNNGGHVMIGILLGVLEIIIGIYSAAHPAVLAVSLGVLIGIYFIESGANMIYLGSTVSRAVAIGRELEEARQQGK